MSKQKFITKHSFLRSVGDRIFFYCRFCHERYKIDFYKLHEIIAEPDKRYCNPDRTYYFGDLLKLDLICPSCRIISKKETIINVSGREPQTVFNNFSYEDLGDKVRAYIFFKEISFFSDKLQQNHLMSMVTFNIKTGQTFLFEPKDKNNKRWKHYDSPRLKNISISTHMPFLPRFGLDFSDENFLGLSRLLNKKMQEKFGFPVKSLEDYYKEFCETEDIENFIHQDLFDFTLLANYLRLPNINTFHFRNLLKNQGEYLREKPFNRLLREVRPSSTNPIGDFIKAFRSINTKSIRKIIMNDLGLVIPLYQFRHIKDVNGLRRLVEHFQELRFCSYNEYIANFIKVMLKKAPENIVVNKLLKCSYHYLIDTSRMYFLNLEMKPGYDFDIKLNLEELHDIFFKDYNKLSKHNLNLEYTDKEKEIECDIDGYEFRLARDTHELIDVGSAMHICVGSYGDRAYQKQLHIVVAYKDNEPIICFELSSDMKTILQAKLKHNRRPKDELFELCMKFVEMKNLEIRTIDLTEEESDNDYYNLDMTLIELPTAAIYADQLECLLCHYWD